MKHILLSCLLLLALCATAPAAPVERQTFRVVAPEGWTVTAVPDVGEGVVLVAPDKSVSVTIVTAASGTMTPEQLAADYEQKLHAARVAQNGNYYGLKGMAGGLPLDLRRHARRGQHRGPHRPSRPAGHRGLAGVLQVGPGLFHEGRGKVALLSIAVPSFAITGRHPVAPAEKSSPPPQAPPSTSVSRSPVRTPGNGRAASAPCPPA